MENTEQKSFDCWCIVEIFGHQKYAGRVTEQTIGGCSFVRLDVPELPERKSVRWGREETQLAVPAFTKLFGQGAIYSITPVDESVARAACDSMRVEPVTVYIPLPKAIEAAAEDKDEEDDDGVPY